jgi:hypothetical protein
LTLPYTNWFLAGLRRESRKGDATGCDRAADGAPELFIEKTV